MILAATQVWYKWWSNLYIQITNNDAKFNMSPTTAHISLSILFAYLVSSGVRLLDAYATGLSFPWNCGRVWENLGREN